MKKHIKLVSIVLVFSVLIGCFFVYDKWKYSKVSNIIDTDKIISLSSTYEENGKKVSVNSDDNEVAVWFKEQLVIVPRDKLIDILSKYKSKKVRINYFPYRTEEVILEFSIFQSDQVKNFLMGEFNIWVVSGDDQANEIIDGDKLLDELLDLVGQQ